MLWGKTDLSKWIANSERIHIPFSFPDSSVNWFCHTALTTNYFEDGAQPPMWLRWYYKECLPYLKCDKAPAFTDQRMRVSKYRIKVSYNKWWPRGDNRQGIAGCPSLLISFHNHFNINYNENSNISSNPKSFSHWLTGNSRGQTKPFPLCDLGNKALWPTEKTM